MNDNGDHKYRWIAFMDRLSNGDITKHKQVYGINYIECLTLMAYWHHRDKYIENINRVNSRKNNK